MVSGTDRLTRSERQAQTRAELIDAADRLFRERGFHGTSLDMVAAAAGYTKGAVYSNFTSKEDLFFAVYEQRVDAYVEAAGPMLEAGGDDAPLEMTRRNLGESDAGWLAVFFEFWAHVLRNQELRERFLKLHRRAQEPLVEHGRRWLGAGEEFDAEGWTLANFAMVTGLSLEKLTDPSLDAAGLAVRMLEGAKRGIR